MMRALLRKDWRVYRAAIIGGLVLLLIPYALAVWDHMWWHGRGFNQFSDTVLQAAFMGLGLTVLTAAVVGGAAFAAERRDRSAEFLAVVPVPRLRAVRSKLWVALAFLLATWGVHAFLIVVAGFDPLAPGRWRFDGQAFNILLNTTSVAVMAFGVAWLMSSVVSSPAIAATFAVAATLVTLVVTIDLARPREDAYGLMSAIEFLEGSSRIAATQVGAMSVQGLGRAVMGGLGVAAWCAGTAVFVRRVSP